MEWWLIWWMNTWITFLGVLCYFGIPNDANANLKGLPENQITNTAIPTRVHHIFTNRFSLPLKTDSPGKKKDKLEHLIDKKLYEFCEYIHVIIFLHTKNITSLYRTSCKFINWTGNYWHKETDFVKICLQKPFWNGWKTGTKNIIIKT